MRLPGCDRGIQIVVAIAVTSSACSFNGVTTVRRVAPDRLECQSDIGVPIVDLLTALAGGSLAIAYHAWAQNETGLNQAIDNLGFATTMTIGAFAAAGAIYGFSQVGTCDRIEAAWRAEQVAHAERGQARDAAWAATKQAAAAARAGDCATVARLDADVRTLDADFHATMFTRDVAIARCLGP